MPALAPVWVPHDDLLGPVALACVDGRCQRGVIGAPGGNLGEFIAALAAIESLGKQLTEAQVEAALEQVISAFGSFYHHTDERALSQLMGSILSMEPPTARRAVQLIRRPPPELVHVLLDRLVQPEHVGCGHLAAILRSPEDYMLRLGLVESALRAFFRLLWGGRLELRYEVLRGDEHLETAVVTVQSNGTAGARCQMVVPGGETPTFVFHSDAARWFRHNVVRLLVAFLVIPTGRAEDTALGVEATVALADAIAGHQLEATLTQLACDLPRQLLESAAG